MKSCRIVGTAPHDLQVFVEHEGEEVDIIKILRLVQSVDVRIDLDGSRASLTVELNSPHFDLSGVEIESLVGVGPDVQITRARTALRELCQEFGDNDWPDDLDLSDVIDKHLGRHLLADETERREGGMS